MSFDVAKPGECVFTFHNVFFRIELRLDGYWLIAEYDMEVKLKDWTDLLEIRRACRELGFKLETKLRKEGINFPSVFG